MKKHLTLSAAILAVFVFITVSGISLPISNTTVFAHAGEDHTTAQPTQKELEKRKIEDAKKAEIEKVKARAEDTKAKLDQARLKVCQAREKEITKLRGGLSSHRTMNLNSLNQISDRIQNFYKEKQLTVSNYDALLSVVSDKKIAAEAAVAAIQSTSPSFKCDGTNPQGNAQAFRDEHQKAVIALKEYKTAIKDLFKAVKEAAVAVEGAQR